MRRILCLLGTACLLSWSPVQAAVVLFSTFNPDQSNVYDCCNEYEIWSAHAWLRGDEAASYTPSRDEVLTRLDIALTGSSRFRANRELRLQVMNSNGRGWPMTVLENFVLTELPPYHNPCCSFETKHFKGVALKAGQTYWIAVLGMHRKSGDWQYNTLGKVGQVASNTCPLDPPCWEPSGIDEIMPAFRLWGDKSEQ